MRQYVSSDTPGVQPDAAVALARMGVEDDNVIRVLLESLCGSEYVAVRATLALGELKGGSWTVRRALEDSLKDDRSRIREAAAAALKH